MKTMKLALLLSVGTLAACSATTDAVSVDQSELARAATVAASGQITDRITFNPIAGAQICIVGNTTCATSDANGAYSLQVPSNADVAVVIKETTHVDTYLTFSTNDGPFQLGPLRVMDTTFDASFSQQAGGERNPTTGSLVVAVFDQFPNPGGVIENVSLETSGGGGHMFYTDGQGVPSSVLEGTSSRGVAGVVNMRPGVFTLWLAHPSMNCKNSVGWKTPSGDGIKTQIFAGGTTVVYAVCTT
jgi:hypothetical protein